MLKQQKEDWEFKMSLRPKQLARLGLFQLYEAILDVLLQAYSYSDPEYIGLSSIGEKAGIPRDRNEDEDGKRGDDIAMGCLYVLLEMRKVERGKQPNGARGWRLTKEEYERRKDDV